MEWAWAAGIIDGEGTIGLHNSGRLYYTIVLAVVMTHEETIIKLLSIFKCGNIKFEGQRDPKHKSTYKWRIRGSPVKYLLARLLPYLITKRKQAELGLEYFEKCWRQPSGKLRISIELEALRSVFFNEFAILNHKGT